MELALVESLNQLLVMQAPAAGGAAPAMSFDLLHMWAAMGPFAKFIAIVLGLMSVYSLAVRQHSKTSA